MSKTQTFTEQDLNAAKALLTKVAIMGMEQPTIPAAKHAPSPAAGMGGPVPTTTTPSPSVVQAQTSMQPVQHSPGMAPAPAKPKPEPLSTEKKAANKRIMVALLKDAMSKKAETKKKAALVKVPNRLKILANHRRAEKEAACKAHKFRMRKKKMEALGKKMASLSQARRFGMVAGVDVNPSEEQFKAAAAACGKPVEVIKKAFTKDAELGTLGVLALSTLAGFAPDIWRGIKRFMSPRPMSTQWGPGAGYPPYGQWGRGPWGPMPFYGWAGGMSAPQLSRYHNIIAQSMGRNQELKNIMRGISAAYS